MNLLIVKIAAVAILAIFILLIVLGITKKVVVFFNVRDLLITLLTFLAPLVGLILIFANSPKGQVIYSFHDLTYLQLTIAIVSALVTIAAIILTFAFSIEFNKSIWIGIIIGLFKIVISFLLFFILLGQVLNLLTDRFSIEKTLPRIIFIGLLAFLARALINGYDVYLEKGWDIPTLPRR